jgi:hypothetical protein
MTARRGNYSNDRRRISFQVISGIDNRRESPTIVGDAREAASSPTALAAGTAPTGIVVL